jgi:formate dehydrogenase major subunit
VDIAHFEAAVSALKNGTGEMLNLTIDDKPVEIAPGATILEAAESVGIDIPTLCHQDGLGDVGACRMCIVEIEGGRRPVPSCTTPAEDGMVVRTDTPALRNLRRQTLELLFAERNHICPACTESGHCDLQTLGYRLGMTHVRYPYLHPALPTDLSHPTIALDHNRCILCTRCVRVCDERIGVHTLDVQGRGGRSMIVADSGVPLGESSCIACGACVQVCPTGAIFEKRTSHWQHETEAPTVRTVCPSCDVGCLIDAALLNDAILEIAAADGPANQGLVCRHGRFGLVAARPPRLTRPMLRKAGRLTPVDESAACQAVASRLSTGRIADDRTRAAGVASTRLPVEVLAVFKQFMSEIVGTPHVGTPEARYTRALRRAVGGEAVQGLAQTRDLDDADLFVTVGCDPDEVQGVVGMALRRGVYHRHAPLLEIDPGRTSFSDRATTRLQPRYGTDTALLTGLLKAMTEIGCAKDRLDAEAAEALAAVEPRQVEAETGVPWPSVRQAAATIAAARRPVILFGPGLARQGEEAIRAALNLALACGPDDATGRLGLMPLLGGATAMPAAIMGLDAFDPAAFDPHEVDLLVLLMGDDAEPLSKAAVEHIRAVPFTVLIAAYEHPLMETADVVFPTLAWPERQGTFVNIEGRVQRAARVLPKPSDVPDETETLARLAAALGQEGVVDGMSAVPEWVDRAGEGECLALGRDAADLDIVIPSPEGT